VELPEAGALLADRRLEVNRISLQAKARDGKSEAQIQRKELLGARQGLAAKTKSTVCGSEEDTVIS
jgi:hypothetical protein